MDQQASLEPEDDYSQASHASSSKRGRYSKVWDIFKKKEVDPDGRQRAECMLCGAVLLADGISGTSGMNRHISRGFSNSKKQAGQYLMVDHDMYREHISLAIARHYYPFNFVEHQAIRDLHKFLNPIVQTLARNTAKSDLLKVYNREKEKLKRELEMIPGKICLTSDLWSSLTTDGYMAMTGHYIDENWTLRKKVLIFRHIPSPHNGPLLGDQLIQFLKEWGIERKIFSVTLDNASYQNRIIEALKDHFLVMDSLICNGDHLYVRCGAHILKLIVQHGLKAIDSSVVKIRESVKFVRGSEMRGMKFAECVKYGSLDASKKLQQDVPTRWNSTYLMLDSALPYRAAFNRLQRVDGLYEHCPSDYEWMKIKKVAEFLQPFYKMTLLFSGSYYPTANLYFLKVWRIELLIRKNLHSFDDFIHGMAKFMNEKFKKYWDCYSVILSLAFILDPRYKLRYLQFCFEKLDPLTAEAKVKNLKDKLEVLFEEYLQGQSLACSQSQDRIANAENDGEIRDELDLEFDSYNSQHEASISKSQLDIYLEEKLLPRDKKFNILDFWKGNMLRCPELSLLARDILSIPITTVASESAFSHGGRILGKFRNALLPSNVEALLCSRDWIYGGEGYDASEVEEDAEMSVDVQRLVAKLGSGV